MARTGKIARLPREIREELNHHLECGLPGRELVEWLNSLPDVHEVLTKSFDGRGNYTMGIREGLIFPEIHQADKLEKPKGMNITITTTARTDEQGRALLKHFGMPFRN